MVSVRGQVIGYASRTGTRRNLAALRAAGWRIMVSARGPLRPEGFAYALDNGAWTAHQEGKPFDELAFWRAFGLLGHGADFVVAPDVVAGGLDSLRFTERWLPKLDDARLVLVAVQDGMEPADVRGLLGPRVGLFLGGSTEWKLARMRDWGAVAREVPCYYHVGRVNTRRRIRLCWEAGADSFDGTSASRFALNVPRLDAARRQSGFTW